MFKTSTLTITILSTFGWLCACDDGGGSGPSSSHAGTAGSSGAPHSGGSSATGSGSGGVSSGGAGSSNTDTGGAGSGGTALGGTASAGGGSGGASSGGANGGTGGAVSEWKIANLTNYESYPDPNSEECIEYNGCMWAGMFAAVDGKQTEQWVMEHDIIAVHQKDFDTYKLKTLRLRSGGNEIDAVVYDMCADSDCDGCCTANSAETGFLIDIEKYTMQRFGSGDGIVEWACIDCD
jgi:hypothetical protein